MSLPPLPHGTALPRPGAARALLALAALLLAACDGPPTPMAEMRATMDAQLAGRGDATSPGAAVALDRGFGSALRAAVEAHEGYRSAAALERSALAQIGVAAGLRRPQLTGDSTLGALRETGAGARTSTGVAGGVSLSQLVFDGGATTAAVNRATAEALAAQAGRRAEGNALALSAAQAWLGYWEQDQRLRLLRGRTAELDGLVAQMERMAGTGMLDRAALDGARRQIVDIRLDESRLEAGRAEAQAQFRRFFGQAPASVARPAELVSAARARQLAQDWQHAPALQRQAAQMLAARAGVDEARAAFRPTVQLQGGVRSPLQRGESTDLNLGLTLQYRFSDGGRRARQLEAAQTGAEAREAQLGEARRGLELELQTALARLAAIDRALPLTTRKQALARSEAETARAQILTGQSSLRQLVEAEIEAYRAADQQITLQVERQTLLLTVAARTGALAGLLGMDDAADSQGG